MKKIFLLTVCQILLFSLAIRAQKSETIESAVNTGTGRAGAAQTKEQYYALNPKEDKTETIDITGTGSMSFSVANQTNGSGGMGYIHSENITVSLQSNVKNAAYQLVFYSDKENFQKIMSQEGNLTTVYFPMSMYSDIKQKIDQAIAQKKKAQLKLVQKKDGYTEATLLF